MIHFRFPLQRTWSLQVIALKFDTEMLKIANHSLILTIKICRQLINFRNLKTDAEDIASLEFNTGLITTKLLASTSK